MKTLATLSLLTILCLMMSLLAHAQGGYLYTNGPTNGTSNSFFIDVFAVSDSFQAPSNNTVFGFTFAEWVPTGAIPLTVDWAVGTSSFGNDVGSGSGRDSGQPALHQWLALQWRHLRRRLRL